MLRTLSPILAVALLAAPIFADEPKTKADTPEAAARRAMDALREDRLDDFAKAMHPEALKGFKSVLVSVAEAAVKDGREGDILALFTDVKDVAALKKLDDTAFFASFFRGVTRLRPELKKALGGADVEIIGHVMEGKDTAHVVHRMTVTVDDTKVTKTDVISMRKTETGWGMLLTGDIDNLATLLKRQFGGGKK